MTGWFAYARPFAKRRALYRMKSCQAASAAMKSDELRSDLWERSDRFSMAAEAVEYTWHDFKQVLLTK